MRKGLLVLFAAALALVAPAVAVSQPLPQNLFVEAALYSNVVTVYGDDLADFEIVLEVKNAAGVVLARMDVYPPYGPSGQAAAFFLTDWADAASYLGLLPGEWLELEFRRFGDPGPKVSHRLSDITFTSLNAATDTIQGRISPPQSETAFLNFSGMKFVREGQAPSYSREVRLRDDGTFSLNTRATADLLHNARVFLGYQQDVFGIYIDGFAPGLIVLEDTPFAIATGTPLVGYQGRIVKPSGAVRGTSTAQPLQWLGVGLFQFHRGRAGAPLRRGDTVRVRGDHSYAVKIPKNFKVKIIENSSFVSPVPANGAAAQLVLTAPPDNLVCLGYLSASPADIQFSCGTLADLDDLLPESEIDLAGNLVINLYNIYPGLYPLLSAVAFTGGPSGDIFVSHSGLQNPLSFVLPNLGTILSPPLAPNP